MGQSAAHTACVMMTGPDVQMDHCGDSYEPINPLPVKCRHCTFPNLDFIPEPYVLSRGVASPAETANAHFGNFLVRERVKRILELAVPGACSFHATVERKGNKPAPWWLGVPKSVLKTTMPEPKPPFCSKCHEPKLWNCAMGPVWAEMCRYDSGGVDVFKSVEWHSRMAAEDQFEEINRYRKKGGEALLSWREFGVEPPTHAERWTRLQLQRELYFSVRLEQLFKRAKVKGQLVRLFNFKEVNPSGDDGAWTAEKLDLLSKSGLADVAATPAPKSASAANKWFQQFLKRNATKVPGSADFAAVEKKHGFALPDDYRSFIQKVGPKSFKNVNATEGFTASVLPPDKLDFKNYRREKVPYLDEEQSQVDGVMFADTEHGDCFVFDASDKNKDFPVFWYDHEQNTLEPFAPNFAECIRRFVRRS